MDYRAHLKIDVVNEIKNNSLEVKAGNYSIPRNGGIRERSAAHESKQFAAANCSILMFLFWSFGLEVDIDATVNMIRLERE